MTRLRSKIAICLTVMLVLAACATSPVGKAFDVLYSSGVIYDTALTYAGDQYRAGRLSEAEKNIIVEYARKYRFAVEVGQTALRAYKQAELIGDDITGPEKTLSIALDSVSAAQRLLTEYIQMSSGGDS